MLKNKSRIIKLILAVALILCICFLKKEHELAFEKIGSFDWVDPISSSERPPYGSLWWSITQQPESYISLDAFIDLYEYATGLNYRDTYKFDFENYTYIVVAGHDLQSISYNHWDIWGRFTAKYPWYHGKVILSKSENPRAMNIYRIKRMLINSDEHSRGDTRDPRIVILE